MDYFEGFGISAFFGLGDQCLVRAATMDISSDVLFRESEVFIILMLTLEVCGARNAG
jgi:hypothetical protein